MAKTDTYTDNKRKVDVRSANMSAAKAVADAVRTSLGPRGMDKMVCNGNGEVTITNDGATILKLMEVTSPAAKMLVELSRSQDINAGDGTTSVTVLAGALLNKCIQLISKGVHPTVISDAMNLASDKACEILTAMSTPVDLNDRDSLIKSATTSLSSKVVSQHSSLLAPMAVDCVLRVSEDCKKSEGPGITQAGASISGKRVDLNDVRIVKKLGGTVDDTEFVEGLVFDQKATKSAGGPTKVKDAKVALIQFCVSPPKTDLENNVVLSDYAAMDRLLKEERNYILGMVKKIKASGCNVLLIQKSILRDATTELSLHYLAKAKILVVRDIERDEIEFISKTLNCLPIAHIDHMKPEKLGHAELVEEVSVGASRLVKVTGIPNMGRTATVVVRGSNKLVLEEADRSLHDALCVVRCLVQRPFLIAGGGAPEIELSRQLRDWAKTLPGLEQYCVKAFAEAMEVIPYTLAENAGLNPIQIVTELVNMHAKGNLHHGINVRKGTVTNILDENVVQPLQVSTSAVTLATECVRMILKIDDVVMTR
uniref:T-complex protein 1 subunit delta n=1 Tax=Pyramimonas obovata TaxID=1411642 RepID=A0A7S0QWK5_9CHLO|mmetsp:Transcript_15243/g.32840  ORF Transcript_15243/g.32840 Transcript_15243/m.32840 type:complete len:539 (+) Transcript_15243:108-1724(+)|eukprot:CAMPEP_0118934172 /NCGR_PEP_ID=MMETSP1169-20130426/13668_1 /TAXON_ID=36882 /ORGANISM="Pyramimonas obovata, Strain CCMP722" /LENGTH=538 /DNA_ID=CAMNT_0006877043 /DNA_START=104 /DNA_END=1720 /DNA_ORIENTATION=+